MRDRQWKDGSYEKYGTWNPQNKSRSLEVSHKATQLAKEKKDTAQNTKNRQYMLYATEQIDEWNPKSKRIKIGYQRLLA